MELLDITESDDVGFEDISNVVERDVTLTAEVIRLVNSAAAARDVPVQTALQAVQRIGFVRIRQVALRAMTSIITPPCEAYAPTFEALHLHAIATARLTRKICRAAGRPENEAFLDGLFHDVGYFAVLMLLVDVYGEDVPPLEDSWEEIGRIHGRIGATMCELWELPAGIREVALARERPTSEVEKVVALAEHIAVLGGAVHPLPVEPRAASLLEGAATSIGLSIEVLRSLEEDAEELVAEATKGFG